MRLQVSVQRHSLPPVQIIFTTGTGPASHTSSRRSATVADLLRDVNDLVPLESADGEWGLEDYIVEVAATADQDTLYECLHFQSITSVLREDDEVVIRALREDERRARRLGGRVQISGDGRHLVDGVGFGKRWLRIGGRPGVKIPARKKRRLLGHEDTEEGEDDEMLKISDAHTDNVEQALVVWADENEDEDEEDDDDDFVEETTAESGSEEDEVDSGDEAVVAEGRAVTVREDFDDADTEDDPEAYVDHEQLVAAMTNGVLPPAPSEVVDILAENTSSWPIRKRKRALEDDGGESEKENNFSGFSTPAKSPAKRLNIVRANAIIESDSETSSESEDDSMSEDIAKEQEQKKGMYILPEDQQSENSESYGDSSSSDSSSDSDADSVLEVIAEKQEQKKNMNILLEGEQSDTSDSYDDSSSDDSSSSSDESDESDADSEDHASQSSTSSGSASSSSSSEDESQPPVRTGIDKSIKGVQEAISGGTQPSSNAGSVTSAKPQQSVPGQGTNRTKSNNTRAKLRKRLAALKNQGILPLTANFDDLKKHDERQNAIDEAGGQIELQDDLETARQQLLSRFQIDTEAENQDNASIHAKDTDQAASSVPQPIAIERSGTRKEATLNTEATESITDEAIHEPQSDKRGPTSEGDTETTPKRAKLDLQSTRRMLFNSLGLRTPKTKVDEQKLRDKLAKSVREPPKLQSSMETTPHEAAMGAEDISWKQKLIVSAVECEREGTVMSPPSFPFEQNWTKPRRKLAEPDVQLNYDEPEDLTEEPARESSTLHHLPAQGTDDVRMIVNGETESRTVSFGNSDLEIMPIPEDYDVLPDLQAADLVIGTVIAYKELHVSAVTNFQPEISPYRVARIRTVDANGSLVVLLAMKDRDMPAEQDSETGERIFSKFELHEGAADDEVDDGVRDVDFQSMIKPKLVERSITAVSQDNQAKAVHSPRREDHSNHGRLEVVPETAPAETSHDTQMSFSMSEVVYYGGPQGQVATLRDEPGLDIIQDGELLGPDSVPNADKLPPSSQPEPEQNDSQPNRDIASDQQALYRNSELQIPAPHQQASIAQQSTKSSSHQDAQRVSPPPQADLELTNSEAQEQIDLINDQESPVIFEDKVMESIQPILPHTNENEWRSTESEREMSAKEDMVQDSGSFLGERGYDGAGSSYPKLNDEEALGSDSDSANSLPSVSFFTSSQIRRRSSPTGSQIKRASSELNANLISERALGGTSTPPTSSPRLTNGKTSLSPLRVKVSASQFETNAPSISQIPVTDTIIDLTQNSSPVDSSGSDREYQGKTKKPRRRKQKNKANITVRAKKSAAPMNIRFTEPNLGTKKFLTAKKSQV